MGRTGVIVLLLFLLPVVCMAQGRDGYYTVELEVTYESITKDFLLGKTRYEERPDFVVIDQQYTDLSAPNAHIQKRTYKAFIQMYEAALKDGIKLKVTSASRNYFIQRIIWEQKWVTSTIRQGTGRVKSILSYNAIPGTSRHHWGTELDFISPKLPFWESAYGKKVYAWLKKNAWQFGFYQPYTAHEGRRGYREEKWHWSYAPLSRLYTSAYKRMITQGDIRGFAGDKYLDSLNIIGDYVLGVALP